MHLADSICCSVDIPSNVSEPLRDLLNSLLAKSPSTRPSIPSLWSDPWVTSNGTDPMPSYEDNVSTEIQEPSGEEVDHALAAYRGSAFLAMSAAAKFKGLLNAAAVRRKSEAALASSSSTDSEVREGGGGDGDGRVMVDSPEMVSSPVTSPNLHPSSTLSQSSTSPSSSPSSSRNNLAGNGRRPAPREQTTMSSLSIGEATSRWTLSTPTSVSGGSAGREKAGDEQEEHEDEEMRSRSASPTPMPASPQTTDAPAEEWGGTTSPSRAMDEAGVVKPEAPGGTGGGADVWEDPE